MFRWLPGWPAACTPTSTVRYLSTYCFVYLFLYLSTAFRLLRVLCCSKPRNTPYVSKVCSSLDGCGTRRCSRSVPMAAVLQMHRGRRQRPQCQCSRDRRECRCPLSPAGIPPLRSQLAQAPRITSQAAQCLLGGWQPAQHSHRSICMDPVAGPAALPRATTQVWSLECSLACISLYSFSHETCVSPEDLNRRKLQSSS